jgi:integrase
VKRVKGQRYLYDRDGTFYFRRSIPPDLRPAFGGKTEVITSLGRLSLAQARHAMNEHLRRFDHVSSLARGTPDPTAVIADVVSSGFKPMREDMESAVRLWRRKRLDVVVPEIAQTAPAQVGERTADLAREAMMARERLKVGTGISKLQTTWIAEELVQHHHWKLEQGTSEWSVLERLIDRAQQDLAKRSLGELNGEPIGHVDALFSPDHDKRDEDRQREWIARASTPVAISGLLDRYMIEHKIAPSTEKSWRRVLLKLKEFLGHDDAHAVTTDDLIRWKDLLLTEVNGDGKQRTHKTVREGYVAALKAVFKYAHENRLLSTDPAKGVKMRKVKTQRLRDPGLSDDEALTILRATLTPPPPRMTKEMALARRWVPWLCAYTGARVNEITQLRAEDVRQVDGYWLIHITPEAGSVKNNTARDVPLHAHIVEQGFPQIVEHKTGPLFYNPKRYRNGKAGNPQYKKTGERLAAWVREIGVDDPHVQPNHAWRHRFSTLSRKYKMYPHTVDAIEGHAPATVGEGYGIWGELDAKVEAISLLPRYEV